jgi:hypothetical protein
MTEARPVTFDSLPNMAEVWGLLRGLYGPRLVGATVVAIIDNDGHVIVQTTTLPRESSK